MSRWSVLSWGGLNKLRVHLHCRHKSSPGFEPPDWCYMELFQSQSSISFKYCLWLIDSKLLLTSRVSKSFSVSFQSWKSNKRWRIITCYRQPNFFFFKYERWLSWWAIGECGLFRISIRGGNYLAKLCPRCHSIFISYLYNILYKSNSTPTGSCAVILNISTTVIICSRIISSHYL